MRPRGGCENTPSAAAAVRDGGPCGAGLGRYPLGGARDGDPLPSPGGGQGWPEGTAGGPGGADPAPRAAGPAWMGRGGCGRQCRAVGGRGTGEGRRAPSPEEGGAAPAAAPRPSVALPGSPAPITVLGRAA